MAVLAYTSAAVAADPLVVVGAVPTYKLVAVAADPSVGTE
jgi:hypothetical protein